ncbi:acyltransferase [Chryseobacterium antibioticum]|uniref:Acyltransferase n=1 Tax=Chryseobacterium pyrolae TaxID=2987481 RepID=A0ABT2IHN0_9FLAO|nr:acyltransferase [Chryseobacterium pyrolae]MCT2407873.1 acyltransferase [Chryseobacterium pyrolae]
MKFGFINSARGIAILMVISVHISQIYHFKSDTMKLFFDYGQMGVQLFFIASAFTLCISHDSRKTENHATTNFYIRRFFRIFPIYYLGIILYYFLNSYFKDSNSYTPKNILANIVFLHGLIPSANNSIVPGGWSIGTEMLFYTVFPFLHKFLFSGYLMIKSIFIIFICYFLFLFFKINITNNSFLYFNILVQLPVFIIGILYYNYNKKISLLNAIFIFIAFTVISFYFWKIKSFIFVPLLSGISFCGLIKILEKTFINNIIFQKIGMVSYSIYIIHFILAFYLLDPTEKLQNMLLYLILTIVTCYPVALILERYLEKPFINLGNKIIKHRDKTLIKDTL